MLIDLRRVQGVSMAGFEGVDPAIEAARRYLRPDGQTGVCAPGLYYNYTRKACLQLVGGKVPPEGKALAVSTSCPPGQLLDPVTRKCRQVGQTAVADVVKVDAARVAGNAVALVNTAKAVAAADPTNAAKAANVAAAAAAAATAAKAAQSAAVARAAINTQQATAVVALAAQQAAPLPVVVPTPAAGGTVMIPSALVSTTTPTMVNYIDDTGWRTPSAPGGGGGGGGYGGGGGGSDWGGETPAESAPAAPPPGLFGLTNKQLAIGAAALVVVGYLMFHKGGGGVGALLKPAKG